MRGRSRRSTSAKLWVWKGAGLATLKLIVNNKRLYMINKFISSIFHSSRLKHLSETLTWENPYPVALVLVVVRWSKAPDWELRSKVIDSNLGDVRNFSTPDWKKSTKHSQSSQDLGYKHLHWPFRLNSTPMGDSYKGVDHALTLVMGLSWAGSIFCCLCWVSHLWFGFEKFPPKIPNFSIFFTSCQKTIFGAGQRQVDLLFTTGQICSGRNWAHL